MPVTTFQRACVRELGMDADSLPSAIPDRALDTGTPVLEMHGIRKIFPGVVALDNVDFDVRAGEVHALLGENGAGKSTLIKIIAGVYRRDGGEMMVAGESVDFRSPADALDRRIKVVYQELDLVDELSVAENVFLGGYPRTPRGFVDFAALRERSKALLAELGQDFAPDLPVGELRVAEQQLRAGRGCILDLVAREAIRSEWQAMASRLGARFAVVECTCSEVDVHRQRVQGRSRNIPGWYELTWERVQLGRELYVPLLEPKVEVDAVDAVEGNVARVLAHLADVSM